jgi:hypothetical protein
MTTKTWQLDKKIPLGVIVVLAGHTFFAIWYASNLSTRVEQIELSTRENRLMNERMARIEESVTYLTKGQDRIEAKIDKVTGKNNVSY